MCRWNNESDEEPDGADTVDVATGQAMEQSADAVKALEVECVGLIEQAYAFLVSGGR